MIFSNPSEYAIRALSELVLMSQDVPVGGSRRAGFVMLDKLTEQANLPREFLAKIFRQLVEGGVLTSAKGPGGGFSLAKPAHEVSLLNVIEIIDGGHQIDGCVVGLARCNDHMPARGDAHDALDYAARPRGCSAIGSPCTSTSTMHRSLAQRS